MKIRKKILSRILPFAEREALLGDFDELYLRVIHERGRIASGAWFWGQVLLLLAGSLRDSIQWRSHMFKNYLKIALRNIRKHKSYSLINFSGLTLGMTCALLIVLVVRFELSFDKFHRKPEDIFRVVMHQDGNSFGGTDWLPWTPPILAPTMKSELPEIESVARFRDRRVLVTAKDKNIYEDHFCYTDPEFFDIFSFPVGEGDAREALARPFNVLITRRMAQKYFGHEDPVGKTLKIDGQYDFQVMGILENCPANTFLQFDFLASFITLRTTQFNNKSDFDQWGMNFHETFLRIRAEADSAGIEPKLAKYSSLTREGKTWSFHIQPLSDIHLKGIGNRKGEGDIRTIFVFSAAGILLLLIACFNYVNLSTARSLVRAREIGVRKVVGAGRPQLIRQLLGESVIFSAAAAIVSFLLVTLILPAFSQMIDKKLSFHIMTDAGIAAVMIGLAIICGLLSGSYPAFVLSSFHPSGILKGHLASGSKRRSLMRNSLVGVQFVISIAMIICTLVVYAQLSYIRNRDLGFRQDHIIVLPLRGNVQRNFLPFKNELSGYSPIEEIASSQYLPINIGSLAQANWSGKDPKELRQIRLSPVDDNYVDFYDLKIIEGRNFSKEFPTDVGAYLLNETAAREFGFADPVGKRIRIWGREGEIVGLIKDFHTDSLHLPVEPVALRLDPAAASYFSIKIKSEIFSETIALIEKTWKKYAPEYPFEYSFLDERIGSMYRAEQRLGRSFKYLTGIAIFIACLGLIGLASFMTERRIKEIGIRKVLGAPLAHILYLLSRDVLFLVVIANGLAWVIGYAAMSQWLRNFAYRTNINPWLFLLSGLSALVIAILTISYHTVRAARANPVEALKYE